MVPDECNLRRLDVSNIEFAYRRFCRERFPLPARERVSDLEKRLRVVLPIDFRQYLLEYNGGIFTEPEIVPPSEDCPIDRLTLLGGIGATEPCAELAPQQGGGLTPALFDNNNPPKILPIGDTMMGNLIFIRTERSANDYGSVAMKIAFSDKSFFLSRGIDEFFRLLREPKD
jgi:hypothetical protein